MSIESMGNPKDNNLKGSEKLPEDKGPVIERFENPFAESAKKLKPGEGPNFSTQLEEIPGEEGVYIAKNFLNGKEWKVGDNESAADKIRKAGTPPIEELKERKISPILEEMNRVEAEAKVKISEELGIKNGFVDVSEEDYKKKSLNK